MATRNPEPSNIRRKIIGERIKIALAGMGRKTERKWMKKMASAAIHKTNEMYFRETAEFIQKNFKD